jgi:BMFP domain-containing protein YqiC
MDRAAPARQPVALAGGAAHIQGSAQSGDKARMAQTSNRLLDDIARLMTDAAGAADGVRREIETVVKGQIERLLRDMDIARREEVEVLRDMVAAAREDNEQLAIRVKALEAQLEAAAGTRPGAQAGQGI